jgi:hypothetical protein
MILTPAQYRNIQSSQREELARVKKQQKVKVYSTYLKQANSVIELLGKLPESAYLSRSDFLKNIVRVDKQLDLFNEQITPVIRTSIFSVGMLGYEHTLDFATAALLEYAIPDNPLKFYTNKVNSPVPNSNFQLSKSIWGERNRDKIYADTLKLIESGKPRNEISKMLETKLKDKSGSQFYRVNVVLDTEYNRIYEETGFKSTKELNEQTDQEILWVRTLSAAHKVEDICDDLEGAYRFSDDVPQNPHPQCACIKSRVFAEDYKGTIKELKFKKGVYRNSKNQSTYAFSV